MSIFEPAVVRAILSAAEPPAKRPEFMSKWEAAVQKRCRAWATVQDKRIARLKAPSKDNGVDEDDAPNVLSQASLSWTAEIIEYVNYLSTRTRVHGNSKTVNQPVLSELVPLMGPRFVPPPPTLVYSRRAKSELKPDAWYIRPVNVVHEFFYPGLRKCQVCGADKSMTAFDGWTATVPRRVHGITVEELAVGQQLECKKCRQLGNKPSSYALAGAAFWKQVSYDDIPTGIPIFTKRCALTRELFNIVIELRLGSTASGFAETIRQLHLQQYFNDKREYTALVLSRASTPTLDSFMRGPQLLPSQFSEPYDNAGYALAHISGDVLTEIYLDFVKRTRRPESEMYLKSLTGISLSIDTTFKITNKATVVQSGTSQRERLLKGGLFSGVNENNEIVFWRLCQTQSNKEIEETLGGFEQRRKLLNAPPVELCASDNCCKVRSAIVSQLPDAHATLDIFHIVQRYTAKLNSAKSTLYRSAIAGDVTRALIKTPANKRDNIKTEYWSQLEQEQRLADVWQKWSKYDIWQSGAAQMHEEQMGHVRKGCVARTRSDISTDGSRIESSHKGWNSLQRSHASGIEVMEALGHDYVLRRDLRIAANNGSGSNFAASTYGSHHVALVNSIANQWNTIVDNLGSPLALTLAPTLRYADSKEQFGLVWPAYNTLAPAVKLEIAESFEVEICEEDIELGRADAGPGNLVPADLQLADPSRAVPAGAIDAIDLTGDDIEEGAVTQGGGSAPLPVSDIAMPSLPEYAVSMTPCAISRITALASTAAAYSLCAPTPSTSSTTFTLSATAATKRAYPDSIQEPPSKRSHTDPSGTSNKRPAALAPIFRSQSVTSGGAGPSSRPFLVAGVSTVQGGHASKSGTEQKTLSRSAALFKAATGVHPDALSISGDEWFLFAKFRVTQQLRTYEMTPARIGAVTKLFNDQLRAEYGDKVVLKDPRAVMSTLATLEAKVIARSNANDFTSKKGTDTFWTHQCTSFEVGKRPQGKSRKAHVCKRCNKLMYPFGVGDHRNHARDSCTDGVKVTLKDSAPYPQPEGIFLGGKRFGISKFMDSLSTLQILFEHQQELPLEYQRFRDLLGNRVQIVDGVAYFKFFDELQPEPEHAPLEEVAGVRMLRLGTVGDT